MPQIHALLRVALPSLLLLPAAEARADWTLWADGLASGVSPSIAVSDQREIFYDLLAPQLDGDGTLYRASLDDPQRVFTEMPGFPLPTPQQNAGYNNVMAASRSSASRSTAIGSTPPP
jgi:hypothetical protein